MTYNTTANFSQFEKGYWEDIYYWPFMKENTDMANKFTNKKHFLVYDAYNARSYLLETLEDAEAKAANLNVKRISNEYDITIYESLKKVAQEVPAVKFDVLV